MATATDFSSPAPTSHPCGGPGVGPLDGPMPGLRWASSWRRLAGVFIDLVAVAVIAGVPAAVVGFVGSKDGPNGAVIVPTWEAVAGWLVFMVGWAALMGIVVRTAGATIGMLVLRLRVHRLEDGTRPSLGASLLRWLVFVALLATGIGAAVDTICMIASPRGRSLHDQAAGTVVVRRVAG